MQSLNYLNSNGRKNISKEVVKYSVLRVRDSNKNEIVYPGIGLIDYSMNSTLLCIPKDILEAKPFLGDKFSYNTCNNIISNIQIQEIKKDGHYLGVHTFNFNIRHDKLEDDYSHAVIDIIHKYEPALEYKDHEAFSITLNKDNYDGSLLSNKKGFFKTVRNKMRFQFSNFVFHYAKNDLPEKLKKEGFPEFHDFYSKEDLSKEDNPKFQKKTMSLLLLALVLIAISVFLILI